MTAHQHTYLSSAKLSGEVEGRLSLAVTYGRVGFVLQQHLADTDVAVL